MAITRYSGITRKMLKHVHTRIEEVQQRIQQLLPSDAILIGHSLNFDLDALQVSLSLYLLNYYIILHNIFLVSFLLNFLFDEYRFSVYKLMDIVNSFAT